MTICGFYQRGACKFGGGHPCHNSQSLSTHIAQTAASTNIPAASEIAAEALVASEVMQIRTASMPSAEAVTVIDPPSSRVEPLEVGISFKYEPFQHVLIHRQPVVILRPLAFIWTKTTSKPTSVPNGPFIPCHAMARAAKLPASLSKGPLRSALRSSGIGTTLNALRDQKPQQ